MGKGGNNFNFKGFWLHLGLPGSCTSSLYEQWREKTTLCNWRFWSSGTREV